MGGLVELRLRPVFIAKLSNELPNPLRILDRSRELVAKFEIQAQPPYILPGVSECQPALVKIVNVSDINIIRYQEHNLPLSSEVMGGNR
jgi:hypothetical protein